VRLGGGAGAPADREAMARTIFGEHVFCLVCIGSLLVVQLVWMG
jgi:hypothetical protein